MPVAVGTWEGKRGPEILDVWRVASVAEVGTGEGEEEGEEGEREWLMILVHALSRLASRRRMDRRLVAFTPAQVQENMAKNKQTLLKDPA